MPVSYTHLDVYKRQVRTFAYNKDKSVQMENSDSEGGLVDYDR